MTKKLKDLHHRLNLANEAVSALVDVIRAEKDLIDEKYSKQLGALRDAAYEIKSEINAIRRSEEMEAGAARLPFPAGTVVEEWTCYDSFLRRRIEPKLTGRVGEVRLYTGFGTKADRYASDHHGAVIVVLHKKNGKAGEKYVDFNGRTFMSEPGTVTRWVELGKGWAGWKPLKQNREAR